MPDVIQCPTCSKKFRLPERPPAVFTCTGCGTAMDLSGFRAAAAAPAAPPAGEPQAAAKAEAAPKTKTNTQDRAERPSRAAGGRPSSRVGARAGAGSRARRGRGAEDEDDGEGDRLAPPKKGNAALIWGSIGGLVLVALLAVLVLNKKSPPPEEPKTPGGTPTAGGPGMADVTAAMGAEAAMGGAPAAMGDAAAGMAGGEAAGPTPPPEEPKHTPIGKGQVHEVGYHPEATEDEKKHIDELVQTAVFVDAGGDSLRAERDLVGIGIKAAPRILNVYFTVNAGEGFDKPSGAMKAAIADRMLRRIDGWYDRKNHGRVRLLSARTEAKDILYVARAWFYWWDNEGWKTPVKPWDERSEGNRGEKAGGDEEGGMSGDAPSMGGGSAPDGK